jgi:hypothetical protein
MKKLKFFLAAVCVMLIIVICSNFSTTGRIITSSPASVEYVIAENGNGSFVTQAEIEKQGFKIDGTMMQIQEQGVNISGGSFSFEASNSTIPDKDVQYGTVQTDSGATNPTSLNQVAMKISPTYGVSSSLHVTQPAVQRIFPLTANSSTAIAACKVVVITLNC